MKQNQNQAFRCLTMALALFGCSLGINAQENNVTLPTDTAQVNGQGKEVKNRNVMLGAGDSTTPRTLNIGLPFSGDILINENDIPVVYTFWTQIPTTCWRYDSSLGNMGVMSFAEGALTAGKVGYIVTSWDREPARKLRAYANIKGSTEGNFQADGSVTAPLGNNWGASFAFNHTRNKGSFKDYGFADFQDQYDGFKFGLYKKYKNGKVGVLYKYAHALSVTGAYTPYKYLGNGETEPYPGFDPGHTSFILYDGYFPYRDFFTNEEKKARMGTDDVAGNTSHAFYLYGDHKFKGDYKLKYSMMYMHSKVGLSMLYPAIVYSNYAETGLQYSGITLNTADGEAWEGATALCSTENYAPVHINQFMMKAELTKKFGVHNTRLGTTYMHYHAPIVRNSGLFYQTVEEHPRLLGLNMYIPDYGVNYSLGNLLPNQGPGSYSSQNVNKNALYITDDFKVGRKFDAMVGARIEHEAGTTMNYVYNDHNMVSWDGTDYSNKNPYNYYDYSGKINYVLAASFTAKLTKPFGLVGEVTYNRFYAPYTDYAAADKDEHNLPKPDARRALNFDNYNAVLNLGGGVYLNIGSYLSLVSKVTYITKTSNVAEETAYTAAGEQTRIYPVKYDISTIGWTTDIVSSIKNFNFHFLFTYQDPKYKDYAYNVPGGQEISYSDKNVPALSKILLEIDPSYYLFDRKVRAWASFRYFGKQYGNKTNTVSYKGWWETFCGIDWSVNRYVDLKVQMCNILNYKGVTGSMIGADQITDENQMIGKYFIAEQIRPRAVEFTAAFKF